MTRQTWVAGGAMILLALAVLAPSGAGAEPGVRSRPFTVTAQIELPTARQGGFNEGVAGIQNATTDRTVVAWIVTRIIYADGTVDTVMRWKRPLTLEPTYGFSAWILFKVPDDAAVGTARVVVIGRLVRAVPAAAEGHGKRHTYAVATATFEVKRRRPSEGAAR